MRLVGRAEAALGLVLRVVLVGARDVEHGQQPAVLVGQRDAVALRRLRHGERDGQRPQRAVGQAHVVDDQA